MTRTIFAALAVSSLALTTPAIAHGHKRHHRHHHHRYVDANGNVSRVIGGRPRGCPHAYCGCSASLYLFGRIIPSLNLAANWIRDFPRTLPAPRTVAARRHHVMVLLRHIDGDRWLVRDANSGRHLTRVHVRSIRGYVIVDPRGRPSLLARSQ